MIDFAVVESLERRREPRNLEAIYFITPTEESITLLIKDFKNGSLYKAPHVYVTEGKKLKYFEVLTFKLFSRNSRKIVYSSCKVSGSQKD